MPSTQCVGSPEQACPAGVLPSPSVLTVSVSPTRSERADCPLHQAEDWKNQDEKTGREMALVTCPPPQTHKMALVPCHTTNGYLGCRKHGLAHRACSSVGKTGICLVGWNSKTATVPLGVGLEEGCQNLLRKVWELTREGPCQVGVQ